MTATLGELGDGVGVVLTSTDGVEAVDADMQELISSQVHEPLLHDCLHLSLAEHVLENEPGLDITRQTG
jgi:hypothetical protein